MIGVLKNLRETIFFNGEPIHRMYTDVVNVLKQWLIENEYLILRTFDFGVIEFSNFGKLTRITVFSPREDHNPEWEIRVHSKQYEHRIEMLRILKHSLSDPQFFNLLKKALDDQRRVDSTS